MNIEIITTGYWHHSGANMGGIVSGLSSQITICRHEGTVFAVRENCNAIPMFNISSGERWGDKIGHRPSAKRQCLELLAPEEQWEEIAAVVKKADGLNRPVYKNNAFTFNWITKQIKNETVRFMNNPNYTELRSQLDEARRKHAQAIVKYDRKKKQLVKTVQEDTPDLFGERKSQQVSTLFDARVDPGAIPVALEPFKLEIDNCKTEVERIEKLLFRIESITIPELFDRTA
jgi:hypothetical protein